MGLGVTLGHRSWPGMRLVGSTRTEPSVSHPSPSKSPGPSLELRGCKTPECRNEGQDPHPVDRGRV